jgi:hypothetical protein
LLPALPSRRRAKDQNASGDLGVYDTKTKTITLTGNVVVSQGMNVVRGERVVVNTATGDARVESGVGRRLPAANVHTHVGLLFGFVASVAVPTWCRSYHSTSVVLRRSGRARPSRLHISDYGLPAVIDVDVLDADILVSAVAEAAKGLDLHRIGPHQSSRGSCKRHHPAL